MPLCAGVRCRIKADGRFCTEYEVDQALEAKPRPSIPAKHLVYRHIHLEPGCNIEIEYLVRCAVIRAPSWAKTQPNGRPLNSLALDYIVDGVLIDGKIARLNEDASRWRTVSKLEYSCDGRWHIRDTDSGSLHVVERLEPDGIKLTQSSGQIEVICKRSAW